MVSYVSAFPETFYFILMYCCLQMKVWENIQNLFGKTYKMRGHQLQNDLIALSPSSFESLQVYFSKFKSLVLHLKQCGIDKKYEHIVLAILSKIGPNYLVFFLTLHATKMTSDKSNLDDAFTGRFLGILHLGARQIGHDGNHQTFQRSIGLMDISRLI